MAIPQQGEGKFAGHGPQANIGGSTQIDEGTEVAGQIYFPGGVSLFSGAGVPGKVSNGKSPVIGDLYFRLDGAVGSLIYRCTVPAAGTWVVVL
jgi:hypothetical protein